MTPSVMEMVGVVLHAPQLGGLGALAYSAKGQNSNAQQQVIVCCASDSAQKKRSVRAQGFMPFFRML
eukprot:6971988-Karenia_brevis.AAC.1